MGRQPIRSRCFVLVAGSALETRSLEGLGHGANKKTKEKQKTLAVIFVVVLTLRADNEQHL